jgi:hypothetical protein
VHRQVHLGQADGGGVLFQAVEGELSVGFSCRRSTTRALCTNMPPEPQAGSRTCRRSGSMTLAISETSETGVKNSPPSWAFWSANWVRKYS